MNYIFETPADTAHAIAELILKLSKGKAKKSLPLNIALSGGSTPKLLFEVLVKNYIDSLPWHALRLFWVDERCVPPTDAESNYGMTYNSLLQNVPIAEKNIFRMQGENPPQNEALRYQQLLEKELPARNGFPVFDLILLGMGDDGHTASIFPNNMALLESTAAVSVGAHPVSGQKRITLTGKTINQADEVVFFITGKSKARILKQIINSEDGCEKYPAYHVHAFNEDVKFYLDKDAGTEL